MRKLNGENKKYSVISNYKYCFKNLIKYQGKKYFFYAIADILTESSYPFLAIYLPSLAVSLLTGKAAMERVFVMLIGYMIVMQIIKFISINSENKAFKELLMFRNKFFYELSEHILEMDYEKLESAEGQKKCDAAFTAVYDGYNTGGIPGLLRQFTRIFINVIGLFVYSVLAAGMNIWIFLFVIVSTVIVSLFNVRAGNWHHKNKNTLFKVRDKYNYICNETLATKNGKDIRMYNVEDWFTKSFSDVLKDFSDFQKKLRGKFFTASAADKIMSFIRDFASYSYLIYKMFSGSITVDKFILYIGVIAGFGTWMDGVFDAVQEIVENSVIVSSFRDFMEYGCVKQNQYDESISHKNMHEIKLEDVSYKYPGSEEPVINHLNLTIRKGEKLALLGVNGAGKTTLVKLISGLYKPTSGKIYIDGTDISKVDKKDYYKEFAVVFQDVSAFAFSIASNISCSEDEKIDEQRLRRCISEAGLSEKINSLPRKAKTNLLKYLDKEGIELSGGEMQKLMLARALYKDASFLILDEPTAALDPIAESEMYEKYSSFVENKTSIFISHRLSSTRFCDRIIFLDNGTIAEEGTHDSLMKKNGKYAHMFKVQSHYYKEKVGEVCEG